MGQRLLRLLYRLGPPPSYYESVASRACSEIIVDVGGGTGALYQAIRSKCTPSYYILLEIDEALASRLQKDHGSDVVVGDARYPPLRPRRGALLVLNDALHHVEEWRTRICDMLEPGDCVLIHDYNVASTRGRLLALLERLLGFPAEFTTPRALTEHLGGCGFRVETLSGDGFTYTLLACRKKRRQATQP